ncbi:MAG: outer membrane beta-barrel protein [Terriglobales bacterium]
MRKVVLLIALLGLFSLLTVAQETPKAEVFGGYQFTHTNIIGTGLNFNGWNASVTGNVNKWFGVAGDFSGNYHSETGGSLKVYSYTFGPVISLNHGGKLNPFVHALFGGAHANLSVNGAGSASTNGFSMMMGGGADAKVSSHLAVRLIQADWVYYRFEGVGESKNVRVSTGIVFRF